MKKIIFVLFIISFFLIGADLALACSCVANQTVEDHYEQADTIFSGKVIDINMPVTGIIGGDDPITVNFEVYKQWKGFPPKNILIRTGIGGGDCGYQFEAGEEYLVFSYKRDGISRTNICSGTKLLSNAKNDISLLGPGGLPSDNEINNLGESYIPDKPMQKDIRTEVYNIVSWIFNIILAIILITLLYGIVKRISWGRKLKQVDQLDKQLKEKILKKKHHYQKIIARALVALIILFFLWAVNTFKVCCA